MLKWRVFFSLLSEEQRRAELQQNLLRQVENGFLPRYNHKVADLQFDIEVKLQDALRSDGYLSSSIFEQREAIRWAAFSPDSRTAFLSVRSLQRILNCPFMQRIYLML